jgi:hypothetical protein
VIPEETNGPCPAAGTVTFTSVFPAGYPGCWPHVPFEAHPSLDEDGPFASTCG